jgi:hypothetical protein
MLRVMGTFGLGILFLTISPALRASLMEDADHVQRFLVAYSPFSYVGVGMAILAGMMFALYRASQPHV